jgi:enoyl-CoA hydratase/carnithine racemase
MNANSERLPDAAAAEVWVRTAQTGAVAYLTLNRAAKYNVLSAAMIEALRGTLLSLSAEPSVHAIVVRAEGRAFSAGHDLTEMGADAGEPELRSLFAACSTLMLTIRGLPQPVIASVQGVATAAGCQLVAMCDLAVASTDARFAVSGINLGLFCSTPAVALSRNLLQKPALEMLLTGDFISAARAREYGLINRVVPPEHLDEEVSQLAEIIAAKSPAAISAGKKLFYQQLELPIGEAYIRAGEVMATNAVHADARSGIAKFTRRG